MSGTTVAGNDILTATNPGNSISQLFGDAFVMSESAQGGDDILTVTTTGVSSPLDVVLFGDANFMSGTTVGGSDSLTANNSGDSSSAVLFGDAAFMSVSARGGNDTLMANNSGDHSDATLYGDAGYMSDDAQGGNDTLTATDSTRLYPAMGLARNDKSATSFAEFGPIGPIIGGIVLSIAIEGVVAVPTVQDVIPTVSTYKVRWCGRSSRIAFLAWI